MALMLPILNHLQELLRSDEEVLTTFAELDHYPERPDARYWGPIINSAKGDPPDWPAESPHPRKIFCYLKQKHPLFSGMLEALSSVDAAKLAFAAGLGEQQVKRFGGRDFRFAPRPVDLQAASRQSDLVVCHAGHGTVSTSLLNGTPMFLIPENRQLEQTITARNVCRMGAARMLDEPETGKEPAARLRDALDAALNSSEPAAAARRFAAKHADFDPQRQLTEITELCSRLAES